MSVTSFVHRQLGRVGPRARWRRRSPQPWPWPWRAVGGAAVLLVGLAVLVRPFTSLTLLIVVLVACVWIEGATRLAGAADADRPWAARAVGLVLVVAGVVALAWPGASVRVVTVAVGTSLVAGGVHDVVAGLAGAPGGRVAHVLTGVALLIFGGLVFVWPDVALVVIAVAFGVKLTAFGFTHLVRAVRWRDRPAEADPAPPAIPVAGAASRPGSRRGDAPHLVGSALLLLVALLVASASSYLHRGTNEPSAFYDTPDDVPAAPGQLIRSEPYTQAVPDGARGWLILYTTTRAEGVPAVASAFVMAPAAASDASRPVIAWAHGTEGADRRCAPTVLPEPRPLTGPAAAMEHELAQGRVLVGADYAGLGTHGPQGYLIGEVEGRSVLDAVRAAGQIDGLSLDPRTVVWGHSQGGHAALWAGLLAEEYAPEVDLVGVAAAAPAADIPGLLREIRDTTVGKVLGPFVIRAYTETYPDVRTGDYIDPRGRITIDAMAERCLTDRATLVSLLSALTLPSAVFREDPNSGPLGRRLAENVPTGPIAAPVSIAQGSDDALVLPEVQDGYVTDRCAAGQPLEYRTYEGEDHLSLVDDDSPYLDDLVGWTDQRFAGTPAPTTCN